MYFHYVFSSTGVTTGGDTVHFMSTINHTPLPKGAYKVEMPFVDVSGCIIQGQGK